jgi:hypothetical protein
VNDFLPTRLDGLSAVAVVPNLTEGHPPELLEGIARRRLVATGQPCPCGAQPPRLNRQQRRAVEGRARKGLPAQVIHIVIEHEADCPAGDEELQRIADAHGLTLRRWA